MTIGEHLGLGLWRGQHERKRLTAAANNEVQHSRCLGELPGREEAVAHAVLCAISGHTRTLSRARGAQGGKHGSKNWGQLLNDERNSCSTNGLCSGQTGGHPTRHAAAWCRPAVASLH